MLNYHRRNSRTEVDMLHGPLLRKLLLFALPFAASSILQQLFNSADVAIVGKFASSEALAAVGTNTPRHLVVPEFVCGYLAGYQCGDS